MLIEQEETATRAGGSE